MKRLFTYFFILFFAINLTAQEGSSDLYLIFEFMAVDETQTMDYMQTENFWEGVHQQRVKSGEIIGWDLWSLQPGGESQGSQYMVVTLHKSLESMFSPPGNFMAYAKAAYPKMTDEQLREKFNSTALSRDLTHRVYLQQIASTDDDFDMPLGTVATIDYMKQKNDGYEQAEIDLFQPFHQAQVNLGEKGNWGLLRVILPTGSDRYATHITVNMYKDVAQFAKAWAGSGDENATQQYAVQSGLETREMVSINLGTLLKKVR